MLPIMLPVTHKPLLYVPEQGVRSSEIDQVIQDHASDITITSVLSDLRTKLDKLDWANVTIWRVTDDRGATYFPSVSLALDAMPIVEAPVTVNQRGYAFFDHLYTQAREMDEQEFLDTFSDGRITCCDGVGNEMALRVLHAAANDPTPISGLISAMGCSPATFSETFGIPDSTVRNWLKGSSKPTEWTLKLLVFAVISDLYAD